MTWPEIDLSDIQRQVDERRVFQEITEPLATGRPGDCLRAAVATVLGLPRDAVPHFAEARGPWTWLISLRHFARAHGWDFRPHDPDVLRQLIEVDPAYPVLAAGPSRRGPWGHVVVIAACGQLLHDPHPGGGGLAGPPEHVLVPVPPYEPDPDTHLAELLEQVADDEQPACRVCGCTDERACAGGCWWVNDPEGLGELCSQCLDQKPAFGEGRP